MGAYVNPQNTTEEVAGLVDVAKNTVMDRFSLVTAYADDATKSAMEQLTKLEIAAEEFDFQIPSIGWFFPAPISLKFDPGTPPVAPTVELPMPAFPDAPILQAITLTTGILAYLENVLATGATGVNPAVEDLIWRREQERAQLARDEARSNLTAEWGKRGFDLPDGVLVATLTQEEIDYRNKRLDLSRDIAIKQYELAFENTKFIITQILAMEKILIDATAEGNKITIMEYSAQMEGAKVEVQAAVERLKALVDLYKGQGDVYKARADAQAKIAEVDIKGAEATINVAIAQMQLFLKQAELRMHNAEAIAKVRVAAAEGGGRIAAQLAAGAMAGISVQAHLSASGNIGKSYSGQEALTESYRHTATAP